MPDNRGRTFSVCVATWLTPEDAAALKNLADNEGYSGVSDKLRALIAAELEDRAPHMLVKISPRPDGLLRALEATHRRTA